MSSLLPRKNRQKAVYVVHAMQDTYNASMKYD